MKAPSDRQLRILRLLVAGVKLEPVGTKLELTIESPGVMPATLADMQANGWLLRDESSGKWSVTDAGRMQAGVAENVRGFMTELAR